MYIDGLIVGDMRKLGNRASFIDLFREIQFRYPERSQLAEVDIVTLSEMCRRLLTT